jgi:hypothetical protein
MDGASESRSALRAARKRYSSSIWVNIAPSDFDCSHDDLALLVGLLAFTLPPFPVVVGVAGAAANKGRTNTKRAPEGALFGSEKATRRGSA